MKGLCLCIAICFFFCLQAQEIPEFIRSSLEEGAENYEEIDAQELLADLHIYIEHPLSLNQMSWWEWQAFPLLSEQEKQAVWDYITAKGQLQSLYELQAIQSLSNASLQLLLPFVTLEESELREEDLQQQLIGAYQQILQNQKGYEQGVYVGPSFKSALRYQGKVKQYRWGLQTEKDAGEKLFDYQSAFVEVQLKKWNLLLGDYELKIGQGLLIRQGLNMGKSSEVMQIKKGGPILKPHTSLSEFGFLRGGAMQYQWNKWNVSLFASQQKVDANVVDTVKGVLVVSSLLQNGLHRSANELIDRKRLHENILGTHLQYQNRRLQWGASALYTSLDGYMQQPESISELFENEVQKQWGLSTQYAYHWKNAFLFGELVNAQGEWAYLQGLLLYLSPKLSLSALHRNYPKSFLWRYADAFSESSTVANEKGTYVGLEMKLSKGFKLKSYVDYFQFPWLQYNTSSTSYGTDYLCQLAYSPSKKWKTYLRWKLEDKQVDVADGLGLQDVVWSRNQRWRWHAEYRINDFVLKSRVEWNAYNASNGYLLFQEVAYKPLESKWTAKFRYALFETTDYDSRIYAYEPDVLYAFSVPAHYGSGQRYLLLVKYRFHRKLSAWFRFSETAYFDRNTVKSGWEEIDGNKLTEVKVLLRYKF